MDHDESPTARALLFLELVQNQPGITAERLAARLGVSDRATRRYAGILREAGVPIESTRGPHGGYRIGRGFRLPPLMFTTTEALGLVMSVVDSPRGADDPVASALDKMLRVLPQPIAAVAEAMRGVAAAADTSVVPDPEITARVVQAAAARQRLRLSYRIRPHMNRDMDVDPWAVVVRGGRWYLLCWSHTKTARRVLRVDRVDSVTALDATFTPPPDLDPAEALEEHLSTGWRHRIDIVVDAPPAAVASWIPRSLGHCDPLGDKRTRITASTDEPEWYARQLTAIRAPYRINAPEALRRAARAVAQRLHDASADVL
ncbi:MAG TPA: WYL domain-containing protein [Stackebrandtia sp.]|uniref:helix-turn-helix transcriptional regulator n=1 Tax=Stackebrandtia sp. TaxID=2023065 RepID=UPI002D71E226|nr:WYL domain-containing protein [Stackebrandtia sp.]HZE40638.1 WYL domain-containing protein [Stackebrandtia sp.]